MGCHGALNGLRVANAFATADPAARVLLCAVELCSLHYYYGNAPDKLVANAIFADGAAAVVGAGNLTPRPPSLGGKGGTPLPQGGRGRGWGVPGRSSPPAPASFPIPPPTWVDRRRSRLRDDAVAAGAGADRHATSARGSNPGSVTTGCHWLIFARGRFTPAGRRFSPRSRNRSGLPPRPWPPRAACSPSYGNMSSPTVLFVLDRLREQNAPRPCVALGFGPGLVAEAALFV